MKTKSVERFIDEDKQDENLQMCRRIREERDKKFKTIDGLFAHLAKMPAKSKASHEKTERTKVPSKTSRPVTPRVSRKEVG